RQVPAGRERAQAVFGALHWIDGRRCPPHAPVRRRLCVPERPQVALRQAAHPVRVVPDGLYHRAGRRQGDDGHAPRAGSGAPQHPRPLPDFPRRRRRHCRRRGRLCGQRQLARRDAKV
ncbi:hypothetical protein IWQ56_005737, partial [Coemansia nantahalensis]